jgi:hypothetical protein
VLLSFFLFVVLRTDIQQYPVTFCISCEVVDVVHEICYY